MSADDQLTKIYLESLKDIVNLEQAKTIIGEHIENIDECFNKINQLSTQLISLQVLVVQTSDIVIEDGNVATVVSGDIEKIDDDQQHEQQVQIIQEQTKDDVEISDSIEVINENENNKNNGDNEEIISENIENIIVEENLGIKENVVSENNNNTSNGEENNVEMVISGEDDVNISENNIVAVTNTTTNENGDENIIVDSSISNNDNNDNNTISIDEDNNDNAAIIKGMEDDGGDQKVS